MKMSEKRCKHQQTQTFFSNLVTAHHLCSPLSLGNDIIKSHRCMLAVLLPPCSSNSVLYRPGLFFKSNVSFEVTAGNSRSTHNGLEHIFLLLLFIILIYIDFFSFVCNLKAALKKTESNILTCDHIKLVGWLKLINQIFSIILWMIKFVSDFRSRKLSRLMALWLLGPPAVSTKITF